MRKLVFRMNHIPKKSSLEFPNERNRLSHHVENFEIIGLIVKEKSGKNVGIRITMMLNQIAFVRDVT